MSANRRLLSTNFSINSAGMCGTQRKSSFFESWVKAASRKRKPILSKINHSSTKPLSAPYGAAFKNLNQPSHVNSSQVHERRTKWRKPTYPSSPFNPVQDPSCPSPCSSHWTNWLLLAANQSKSNLLIQYLSRLILLTAYECALVGNHLKSSIPSALIREQARLPRFLLLLLMLLLPPPLLLRYVPGRNVFLLYILPETAGRPCQLLSLAALIPAVSPKPY